MRVAAGFLTLYYLLFWRICVYNYSQTSRQPYLRLLPAQYARMCVRAREVCCAAMQLAFASEPGSWRNVMWCARETRPHSPAALELNNLSWYLRLVRFSFDFTDCFGPIYGCLRAVKSNTCVIREERRVRRERLEVAPMRVVCCWLLLFEGLIRVDIYCFDWVHEMDTL